MYGKGKHKHLTTIYRHKYILKKYMYKNQEEEEEGCESYTGHPIWIQKPYNLTTYSLFNITCTAMQSQNNENQEP